MKVQLCVYLSLFGFIGALNASTDEKFDVVDDPKFITRPCPDLDLKCIRDYFSTYSECEKAHGPAPDPLFISQYSVEIPNCNVTVDVSDAKFEGLSRLNIIEFYFNSKTNKIVIAAETPFIKLITKKACFKYNRKAREPIERTDNVICDYGPMTFTAVIPVDRELHLKNAEIFTYIESPTPIYTIGSHVEVDLDPSIKTQHDTMLANTPLNLQELFVSQGTMLMTYYLQYNICDFGLQLDTEDI